MYCLPCLQLRAGPGLQRVIAFYERLAVPAGSPSGPRAVGQDLEICPKCGMTRIEATESGMMGCSGCYDAFAASVIALLDAMYRS